MGSATSARATVACNGCEMASLCRKCSRVCYHRRLLDADAIGARGFTLYLETLVVQAERLRPNTLVYSRSSRAYWSLVNIRRSRSIRRRRLS